MTSRTEAGATQTTTRPEETNDVSILRRIEDQVLNDPDVLESNESWAAKSDIARFFSGRHILITGATGFLGLILLEKLLRSCPKLAAIYVLVRPKNGKTINQRMDELLNNVLFDPLRRQQGLSFRNRIVLISGDVCEVNLGLSSSDYELLMSKTEIIFHAAATVRFDESLSVAARVNIRGTRQILQLAEKCEKLQAFVHVSTAYSNCTRLHIEEIYYDPPIDADQLLDLVDKLSEEELNEMTPRLLGAYPNTYTYSKHVAEEEIRRCKVPACVFRPSIVLATYLEPLSGWSNNIYGPTGIMIGVGVGLLRVMQGDANAHADLIPVDMCANAMLACAWEISLSSESRSIPPRIYNYVSSARQPITWGEYLASNKRHGINYPTIKCVWYYSFRFTRNKFLYLLYIAVLHFLPALIVDCYLSITGQKPKAIRLYRKIHKFSTILSYFSTQQWTFSDNNVIALCKRLGPADKRAFFMDVDELDWERHAATHLLGLRVYLVGDDSSTLPKAKIRWRIFMVLHRFLIALVFFIVFRVFWCIFGELLIGLFFL